MTVEMESGWLGMLAALWNADGLEAWIAKLVGLLAVMFAMVALFSASARRAASKPAPGKSGKAVSFRPRERVMPPKNRKKKPARLVRRYRPRGHPGTLRPLTRRVGLTGMRVTELPVARTGAPAALRRAVI